MPKQSRENDLILLISDGAPNFHQAFKKEFATHRLPTPKHIRHIRIQGDHNNSKMERMNGEVRDREKVMRGLKILTQRFCRAIKFIIISSGLIWPWMA